MRTASRLVLPLLVMLLLPFEPVAKAAEMDSLISEVEQFDEGVQSKLEEMELTPSPSPSAAPEEELLKEFKEYRHDTTQLLQYILLFVCIGCGICLCCCVVRFIHYV